MKSSRQLKDLIKNVAKEKNINSQILLRNYMLERLLERIALSEYRDNFILKGGMLVAALVGIDARSTMDMDATIKGYPLTKESTKLIFEKILSVALDDGVVITEKLIERIRDEAEYNGLRISLEAVFENVKIPLKVDITTGDSITPKEVEYRFQLLLEDRSIDIWAYNLETVLAEKLETVISRSTANTRMRDFYDIYILSLLQKDNINNIVLIDALYRTAVRRGSDRLLKEVSQILEEVKNSITMQNLWNSYCKKYSYAKDISWQDIMSSVYFIFSYENKSQI
jgi:predicted nucleotidyltransferase component of viral defense system